MTALPARGEVWWCELAVLVQRIGCVADSCMREICAALSVAVDCAT